MSDGLLLDTHVFLWVRLEPVRIPQRVRDFILASPVVFVSVASAWEASVKRSLGKLSIPEPFEPAIDDSGFGKLAIRFDHAEAVAHLPRHHGDPFDRMLVAQAMVERLTLVTRDRRLAVYGIDFLWT